MDEKIISTKERSKKFLQEIKEIKETISYIENLDKKEKITEKEKELEKELSKLKELIDFKALGNLFHSDVQKIGIIKAHKENFQAAYDGSSILNLLEEAELNNDRILTKVEEINEKEKGIIKDKELIKEDETQELLAEIKKIELEVQKLNNTKDKELKTFNKLKTNKKEITDLLKQELKKINVEVLEKQMTELKIDAF